MTVQLAYTLVLDSSCGPKGLYAIVGVHQLPWVDDPNWVSVADICDVDEGATCLTRGIAGASCEAASSEAYDEGSESVCEEGSRFPLVGKRRTEAHYVKHNGWAKE